MSKPHRPPTGVRAVIALVIGAVSGFICHATLVRRNVLAGDFTWTWRAARILLEHHDPYRVIQATGGYPFDDRLNYPLPAALVSLPFAPFPPVLAGALFVGISAALLAWVATREDYHWLPLFLSAPFLKVLLAPQWSPLLVAAALTPALQFLLVAKPNEGLAMFAYNPTWKGVVLGALLLLVSLLILPGWPVEWLHNLSRAPQYGAPAFFFLGPLLLLAALRWRTPEGRMLLAFALVPQRLLAYDQLGLWLIPRRWWSSLLFSVMSWPALVAWVSPPALGYPKSAVFELTDLLTMCCIYLPALYMVLRRPLPDGRYLPFAVPRRRATNAARATPEVRSSSPDPVRR